MGALERSMEWLRPLVHSRAWDYCVVWKLGDDPSRFIEWMGCCCNGSNGENVKGESDEEQCLVPLCRDAYSQHPARTKACYTLAKFPSSIPLYSGVHGDVAMSNQPRWLCHTNTSNSSHSLELIGTQVIIPVGGGLIELFTSKRVPKDQNLIEYINSQYKASMEHEAMIVLSCTNIRRLNEKPRDFSPNEYSDKSLQYKNFVPKLQNLLPVSHPTTYPSFEGSSPASTLSDEHPSLKSGSAPLSQDTSPTQSIEKPKCNVKISPKRRSESVLGCANGPIDHKDNRKVKQKTEREQYQSKNLITERNRRNRIKDGLFALRALVPKITKMDRAAILGDAIDYIDELQNSVKKFEDELREMSEEDSNKNNAELEVPEQKGTCVGSKQMEVQMVQVEVNQIGTRCFLLKLICNQKRGGFTRLMEAINSLGLKVIDANVTTSNGMVLNVLKVETGTMEVEPKILEDTLAKLTVRDFGSGGEGP
ncbi:hypothetical protein LguiB_016215 [Lonicera macranthoides]